MQNVTKFDRPTLKALRSEMQAVLDKFGANLDFEVGNMSFDDTEVSIKVKAKVKGAQTMEDLMLVKFAQLDGIKNLTNAKGQRLVMYKSRSPKYPYVYQDGSKMYKCSTAQAKRLFA